MRPFKECLDGKRCFLGTTIPSLKKERNEQKRKKNGRQNYQAINKEKIVNAPRKLGGKLKKENSISDVEKRKKKKKKKIITLHNQNQQRRNVLTFKNIESHFKPDRTKLKMHGQIKKIF